MKLINSKVHGVLDYLVGSIIIISPWMFGFANGGVEMWIPITLGILAFVYSLLTKYELGLFKIIPFKVHLTIDALSGVLFAASPWIFGFADQVYLPHVIFGLFEIMVVALTNAQTSINYSGIKRNPAL